VAGVFLPTLSLLCAKGGGTAQAVSEELSEWYCRFDDPAKW